MISASPELFLRIQGDEMIMRPIAGTVARSGDPTEDAARKAALTSNEKEVAEHTMLVDLCRNDLSRVAEVDTVVVDELMLVEDYSHVFHLVSNVRARVVPGVDPQDVIAATFPAGTMTGAPKIRAMEIIEDLEDTRRELYAARSVSSGSGDSSTSDFVSARCSVRGRHTGRGLLLEWSPTRRRRESGRKR